MSAIDLHVHSTASDGTLTPTELVTEAISIGLSAMALTDHDTVDGIPEAVRAAQDKPLELIPGIELSCSYLGRKEIHIVGLYIDAQNTAFTARLSQLKETRIRRNRKIVARFNDLGIHFTYEDMLAEYGTAVITRAHFAKYLSEHGLVSSYTECFQRYLSDNGPCYVPRERMSPQEGIELIHNAGGVSVLAHPTLYHLGDSELEHMLADLTAYGLKGIECFYSTYTMGQQLAIRNLATKFGLLPSGGSDFHGANKPHIALGTGKGSLYVPSDILEALKAAHWSAS